MTEELAYYLKQAANALKDIQSKLAKANKERRELEDQNKDLNFERSALFRLCQKFAPPDFDVAIILAKDKLHLQVLHAIGEAQSKTVKPKKTEIEMLEDLEAEYRAAIQARIQKLKKNEPSDLPSSDITTRS